MAYQGHLWRGQGVVIQCAQRETSATFSALSLEALIGE